MPEPTDLLPEAPGAERYRVVLGRITGVEKNLSDTKDWLLKADNAACNAHDRLDDLRLQIAALEVRVSQAREQRDALWESLNKVVTDMLRTREQVREIQEWIKERSKPQRRVPKDQHPGENPTEA